ncbi:MAG: TonB-dependent receptor [Nitrospirales bacterium]|nr:MAG: TonB-dependent receptor [Nitrospirales bacterium]
MKRAIEMCLAVMIMAGTLSDVWGEQRLSEKTEQSDEPIRLDEVVVMGQDLRFKDSPSTSSRLELTPLQTPASIHSIDNVQLKKNGYQSVAQSVEMVPGVLWGDPPGQPFSFSMRGFTVNQITVLRDGIWLGPASMAGRPQNGFNLDRIELLKGPASVLHGQGAIAGTLNMVTKRPLTNDQNSWEALMSYGRYDTIKLGGGAGGSLGETLSYRIDLSHTSTDGYVETADSRSLNGTGSLLWKPVDELEIILGYDYMEDSLPNYWGTPLVSGAFGSKPLKGVVETTDGRTLDKRMRFLNYNVSNEKANSHQYFTHLDVIWKLNPSFSLRNTVYYFVADREWRNAETYTFNATTGLIDRDRFFVSHDQHTVGNRINATVKSPLATLPNRVLLGMDFSYVDFTRRSRFFGNVDSVDPFNPRPGLFVDPGQSFLNPTKITTIAVYFEDSLEVTSHLRLVTALRQDFIRLNRDSFNLDGNVNSDNAFERTFRPLSWRLGVVYDFTHSIVTYGQWTSGADPVGSNIFLVNGNQDFDLTNADQWEIGMKSQFLNGRLEVLLAGYYIERKNILVPIGGGGLVDNVGRQRSSGFELESAMRATSQWSLGANAAFTVAEFESFGANSGNRPPNVPNWVVNAWTRYRNVPGLPFEVGGRFRYVSDRFNNNANTVTLKNYERVDVHVAYDNGPVRILARITNIFDTVYAYWGDTFYPDQVLLGSPRSYELNMQIDF